MKRFEIKPREKTPWNSISSAKDKYDLIKIYTDAGYRNLDAMMRHYNEFSKGGNMYDGNNPQGQQMTRQEVQAQQKVKFLNEINDSQGTNYGVDDYDYVTGMMRGRKNPTAGSVMRDVGLPVISTGVGAVAPVDPEMGGKIMSGSADKLDYGLAAASLFPFGNLVGKAIKEGKKVSPLAAKVTTNVLNKAIKEGKKLDFLPKSRGNTNLSIDELNRSNLWKDAEGKLRKRPDLGGYIKSGEDRTLSGIIEADLYPKTNTYSMYSRYPNLGVQMNFLNQTKPGFTIMEKGFLSQDGLEFTNNLVKRMPDRFRLDYLPEGTENSMTKLFKTIDEGIRYGKGEKYIPYKWVKTPVVTRIKRKGGFLELAPWPWSTQNFR